MSRGAQTFRERDVTKAVKAVVKAGMKVDRVEVMDGKIVVFAGDPETGIAAVEAHNEWDDVK
jgi:hypothetical protein